MSATWRPGPQPRQTRLNLTAKIRRPRPRHKLPRETPKSIRRPPPFSEAARLPSPTTKKTPTGLVTSCIASATHPPKCTTAHSRLRDQDCTLPVRTRGVSLRPVNPDNEDDEAEALSWLHLRTLDRRHRLRRRLRFQRAAHRPTTADRALPQVSIRPQAHDHELKFFHRAVDPFWGGCQCSTHSPAPTGPSVALDTLLRP